MQYVIEHGLPYLSEYGKQHNSIYIPFTLLPPEIGGWSNDIIQDVNYFKNKRVRAYGFYGKMLQKLGANVIPMSSKDIVNLNPVDIDYLEYSNLQTDFSVNLHKKYKYAYVPGFFQPSTLLYLIFNLNTWNQLNQLQKQEILDSAKIALLDNFIIYEKTQVEKFMELQNPIIDFGDQFLFDMRKVWLELINDIGKTNPQFKKMWEDYLAFVTAYRRIVRFNPLAFDIGGESNVGLKSLQSPLTITHKSSFFDNPWYILIIIIIIIIFIYFFFYRKKT